MCLAVPMRVERLTSGDCALVTSEAGELEVDVSLVDEVRAGDYLVVHAGFAIEKLDEDDARERIAMFAAMRGEEA